MKKIKQRADLKTDRRTLTVTATRFDRVAINYSFSAPVGMILKKTPEGMAAEFTSKMFPGKKFLTIKVEGFNREKEAPTGEIVAGAPLPDVSELPEYKGKGNQ